MNPVARIMIDALVDMAADAVEDFADKNTHKSAAEDHAKGLDTCSPHESE